MEIHPVQTTSDLNRFLNISRLIYSGNIYYRRSNEDIVELFLKKNTVFIKHADVRPYIITIDSKLVGRFALINDSKKPNLVMVAFFEAMPDIINLSSEIINLVRRQFPQCKKLCIGLDGHLNYGAGILLDKFNETPSYGLPYTMSYYPDYFKDFSVNRLFTFRFPITEVENFHKDTLSRLKDITIRTINKSNLSKEIKIYTELNNKSFSNHIYWTERAWEEDFEIFHSFRHLVENDNLLIAEHRGQTVGFLLWFPDFNQLLKPKQFLKVDSALNYDVLRFKYFNPIKRIRLAEIAVIPEYQHKLVDLLLLKSMFCYAYKRGYRLCEGGFISETNKNSLNLAFRYIERITQNKVEPFRTYGVFEKEL